MTEQENGGKQAEELALYLTEQGITRESPYEKMLAAAVGWLEKKGVPDAALDAWYLLEHTTKISRTWYLLNRKEAFPKEKYESFWGNIKKRGKRIPLQHLTGEQEFMGLSFEVDANVLIPRQDTENLVETVLPFVKGKRVLDMCTGSGCIAVSLACLGEPQECVGVDFSKKALETARKNAKNNHAEVTFLHSDLFSAVKENYDVIVSNPPYIKPDVIETLEDEVRMHEPRMALDGGKDGLFFYRSISAEAKKHLCAGGRLFFEIGHDQKKAVMEIMQMEGFCNVTAQKDYSGNDRIVYGQYMGE